MIRFFSRIRKSLISNFKIGGLTLSGAERYFLYAIGEIALVMIGILLAFQVNAWNDQRKSRLKETSFLRGIQKDLQVDLKIVADRKEEMGEQLSLMKIIDPEFYAGEELEFVLRKVDTTNIKAYQIFRRPHATRLTNGTYNSLVSGGNANIISNKELLNQIKRIYDKLSASRQSTYTAVKEKEGQLAWKYAYFKRYNTDLSLKDFTNKELIADLNYFYDSIRPFYDTITRMESLMKKVVEDIDNELKKRL